MALSLARRFWGQSDRLTPARFPVGEGSFARPSNSTLQPTSEAVGSVLRSPDGFDSRIRLCDRVINDN
jgi:hypothetical protein